MPVFEIVQVVPQPGPDEYAAILAALTQLSASSGVAGRPNAPAARLRYQDAMRESVLQRPCSWSAAARLDGLRV